MTLYRKTAVTEMVPWTETTDMKGVSVSQPDIDAGSPKTGDMIANDPTRAYDRWLVAKDVFEATYVPVEPAPAPEQKKVDPPKQAQLGQ